MLFSGLNLRRHITWTPSFAKVVEVEPQYGEFLGNKVTVEYEYCDQIYVAYVGNGVAMNYMQTGWAVKKNEIVGILINPCNPYDCMFYTLKTNIASLLFGIVIFIYSMLV
jgi:hypothetical protein